MIGRLLTVLVLVAISAQAHASSNGILTQGLSSSTSSPGSSTSLSALTSALSSNTFDNAAFPQTWTWNSLSTQTALSFTSSSLTTGTVLSLSAPNATTGQALTLSPALGVVSGGTGAKQTGNSGIQDILGATAQLPNWNKALAKVISGKGNARILCVGDSTTMGLYSTNASSGNMKLLAPCGQLVNILNANGIDASYDGYIGFGLNSGDLVYDNRFTLGTGWSVSNSASSASLGGAFLIATGATSSSAFIPTHPVDTFVIWYPTNPSFGGTLNYNIDGGSNTGIAENGTTSYSHTTVSTTLGFHTINFNYGSGGNAWVSAIEAYDSTKSQVIVDNAGWDTASTANWALNTGAAFDPSPACGTFAPDLVVLDLMINDEDQGVALATFKTNLNYIISHCQSSGHTDILVMTPHHINPSDPTDPVSEATQLTYANAMRSVAAAATNSAFVTGVPVVDEFSNLVSFAFENTTLGAIYSPGSWPQDLHMNYFGYGIVGRDLAQTLLPVGGLGGGSLAASNVNVSGLLTLSTQTTPADNTACNAGTMWVDTGFIYVCTASGTVKRATLATY